MGVRAAKTAIALAAATAMFAAAPGSAQSSKKTKKSKAPDVRVENYFGGVFLVGDGGIPDGPCFRIHGRVTSGDFFNNLKSFDSDAGVIFRRGADEVTMFPNSVHLSFVVRDEPCLTGLQPVGTGVYLTQDTMSKMKLSLYWKHGVDMGPAGKIALENFSVAPIVPYAKDLADELPKRYIWSYELGVPAAGVPLTDSLVLVFQDKAGRILARVAARL
jgi:hypothetical protein